MGLQFLGLDCFEDLRLSWQELGDGKEVTVRLGSITKILSSLKFMCQQYKVDWFLKSSCHWVDINTIAGNILYWGL